MMRFLRGQRRDSASSSLAFSDSNVIVARFHALIKLEKVEADEMQSLLENLPDVYAAMLCENYKTLCDISAFHHFLPSSDVLVRHTRIQDDWEGDPRGWDGSWRQDRQAREGGGALSL